MKTNWKNVVSRINAEQFAWPKGWETREQVAEQLECSPERVSEILAPGLRGGAIEKASFPIWDHVLQRKVMVVGYRMRGNDDTPIDPTTPTSSPVAKKGLAHGSRVRHRRLHKQGVFQADGTIRWEDGKVTRPSPRTLKDDIAVV
jgi:hypothetical protein